MIIKCDSPNEIAAQPHGYLLLYYLMLCVLALTSLAIRDPQGAIFTCVAYDILLLVLPKLWHYVCGFASPVFWHPVRCKLRLHFARLFAFRVVEAVALCAPGFSVKVAVADGLGYVLELYVLTTVKVGNGTGNL